MIRGNLDAIPQFDWPPGYSERCYADGDIDAWVKIIAPDPHLQADRKMFLKEFGTDAARISERMLFIVSPDGQDIGTATAWESDDACGGLLGLVHWVFILPEFQGRGLANPLMTATLNRIKQLGHSRCALGTQIMRIPAIHLYLKFGFVPDIHSADDKSPWTLLKPHIKHPAVQNV